MERVETGIFRNACGKAFTHTLDKSLLWLIPVDAWSTQNVGLNLLTPAVQEQTHSAGVNQHNPIETKGATSIYSTKRSGGIQKPREENKPSKKTKTRGNTLQGMCFFYLKDFGFLSLKMYLSILFLWEMLTKLSYITVHLGQVSLLPAIQFRGSLAY